MSMGLVARRASELAAIRHSSGLDNPGLRGWIVNFPAVVASRLGSDYFKSAEQGATEDIGDVFMGLV